MDRIRPTHTLGPGDRRNWSRLIILIDRGKLPGIRPGVGVFADAREIAKAQVHAWQRQRFGQTCLLGVEQASFVDFVHRVGAILDKRAPRGATPASALMAFAQLANAWSRLSRREPDITPESAALTCRKLQVNSAKARCELD